MMCIVYHWIGRGKSFLLLLASKYNAPQYLSILRERKQLETCGFHHSKENCGGNKTLLNYLEYKLVNGLSG